LHSLDPESQAELDALDDDSLTQIVDRVRTDPSGQRQPKHHYTRKFQNPQQYLKVPAKTRVWELRTNHYRALMTTVEHNGRHGLWFFPIKGKRFWTLSECPWH
jgi:hypothetical protein